MASRALTVSRCALGTKRGRAEASDSSELESSESDEPLEDSASAAGAADSDDAAPARIVDR